MRNIRSLQERLVQLEAQMVVLEEEKLDRSELLHLRQPNTGTGSTGAEPSTESWSGSDGQMFLSVSTQLLRTAGAS